MIPLLRMSPIIKAASPIAACKLPLPHPDVTAYLILSINKIITYKIINKIIITIIKIIIIK